MFVSGPYFLYLRVVFVLVSTPNGVVANPVDCQQFCLFYLTRLYIWAWDRILFI
jgi:hypothetical protein